MGQITSHHKHVLHYLSIFIYTIPLNATYRPTSVLCVSFCSGLIIGKKSRFCRERLALGFCSCKDILREKTTGSSLSLTGDCKFIQETCISLNKCIATGQEQNWNAHTTHSTIQTTIWCICTEFLPLQSASDHDTWVWMLAGSGGPCMCRLYWHENEHGDFFSSPCRPPLCISPLYKVETHTAHYIKMQHPPARQYNCSF